MAEVYPPVSDEAAAWVFKIHESMSGRPLNETTLVAVVKWELF